jgi:hypothetical protein
MNRDQYEGTQFDLTNHSDAGPFGDPMRYPSMAPGVDMATNEVYGPTALGFPRAISLWRTVYSSIAQGRGHMSNELALSWIAPYAPHCSTFLPIYANADTTPSAISQGNQYKLDKSTNFWIHSLTSNYLSRVYKYSIGDTRTLQLDIETSVFKKQAQLEAEATSTLQSVETTLNHLASGKHSVDKDVRENAISVRDKAVKQLENFHEKIGNDVNGRWWDNFWFMITKYRDIYQITDFHAENYHNANTHMIYPRWWMEQIGYWGAPGTPFTNRTSVPIYPINVVGEVSMAVYQSVFPDGIGAPYPTKGNPNDPMHSYWFGDVETQNSVLSHLLSMAVGGSIGVAVTYFVVMQDKRRGYTAIIDTPV